MTGLSPFRSSFITDHDYFISVLGEGFSLLCGKCIHYQYHCLSSLSIVIIFVSLFARVDISLASAIYISFIMSNYFT
ncbi:hypothetical protein BCR42DRAFT_428266 [Absidia repens]|uniref:Uncharacterized protein n=1 Tax=Absidia repens TaxID=90262 RepID=A0A1X2HYL3_9FUNG|nr:hypothetical protein BCR42DRAFT_428266 [Absidia repens]